jgi:hypothetical protein
MVGSFSANELLETCVSIGQLLRSDGDDNKNQEQLQDPTNGQWPIS